MAINKRGTQEKAYTRLENQLKSGNKPERVDGRTTLNRVPLTDSDKIRITKEMEAVNKKLG